MKNLQVYISKGMFKCDDTGGVWRQHGLCVWPPQTHFIQLLRLNEGRCFKGDLKV